MAEVKKPIKATKQAASEAEEIVTESPVVEQQESTPEKSTAKAGKRSVKGVKEAEEKQVKEERKAHAAEEKTEDADKPKIQQKPARSRLERRSKAYRKVAEAVDSTKLYGLPEALELVIKTNPTKFDASVELHINLAVDPRQADQNIRGNVPLPAGTGKSVRIAVLADATESEKAKAAGADKIGEETIFGELDKGVIDFDILVATPAMMPKLGKYARVLGPKGIMPNPKSGTVTTDVAKAVTEAKAGRVEYRVDSTGIIHLSVGKVSFGADKLGQNVAAVMGAIRAAKPASLKGSVFIKAIHLTTTMGPSLKISTSETA